MPCTSIKSVLKRNKLLSELSTFGIGGPASLFTEVRSVEELTHWLAYSKQEKIPYFILGKGSNCLFDDRGYDGLVILNKIGFCTYSENTHQVHVGAGYSFSLLGAQTARKGYSGLEFASGIPGTVGGAIYMNAGASGKETSASLLDITYIAETGELQKLLCCELSFSYRTSPFQGQKGAIAAATFQLTPSLEARQKQRQIIDYRTHTQPYKDKSAGCVFRNTPLAPAGALIEQCGLKGLKVGGAEVSQIHANFLINTGGATARDMLELIEQIRAVVKQKMGVELEMEVRYISHV